MIKTEKYESDNGRLSTVYQINTDKNIVTCIITTVNDMPNRLYKYGFVDAFSMDDDIRRYVGIAKCSPDDEFNEATGKKIAEYRATRARQVDINTEIKNFIKKTQKDLETLNTYGVLRVPQKPYETNHDKK